MITSQIQPSSPCIRCGKNRIVAKIWIEQIDTYLGKSKITHTDTVCPDKECQKIVNRGLAQQKQKSEDLKHEREARMKKSQENRKRR